MSAQWTMSVVLVGVTLAGGLALRADATAVEPTVEVVTREDFRLIPLNPLRGDASPKAGVLWGNLRENVPTGALIEFAPDFASPPHIHNITYRAVVIEGTVHNDDPDAENMWMGPGSFWTQPAGEVHVTAVGPAGGMAFLEILSGPYLVQPSQQAFDNGERPINMEERNVVWLDASNVTWVEHDQESFGPEMAFLWGTQRPGVANGTFVKLPSEYTGQLGTGGNEIKSVLIKGQLTHSAAELSEARNLEPGSYFGSTGQVSHVLSCGGPVDCVLYIHATGTYQVTSAE